MVVYFHLGKNVQLNCSAWLNEKDHIYWNFRKDNGEDPNVQEGEEIKVKYAHVIMIHIIT